MHKIANKLSINRIFVLVFILSVLLCFFPTDAYSQDISEPWFGAFMPANAVNVYDWPVGEVVDLYIDGQLIASKQAEEADWDPTTSYVHFDLNGLMLLEPGQFICLVSETIEKNLTVSSQRITGVNVDEDKVMGTAEPWSQVEVEATPGPGMGGIGTRWVTANGEGVWTADFSIAGDGDDEKDIVTIQDGFWVIARQYEGNNFTQFGSPVPYFQDISDPWFSVGIPANAVNVFDWPVGEMVDLYVDDQLIASKLAEVADWDPTTSYIHFDLNGIFSLEPNQTIRLFDGTLDKTMIVASQEITGVDVNLNTVTGTAESWTLVEVEVTPGPGTGGIGTRWVTANGDGIWTADFSTAGVGDDEKDIVEIYPGNWIIARQWDGNNNTQFGWPVPDPTFTVYPQYDYVGGQEWTLGALLTMEIDDPNTIVSPDYTDTTVVDHSQWEPGTTDFSFDNIAYDIKIGDIVTINDSIYEKSLVVSNLEITNIDYDDDYIDGIAEPASELTIYVDNYEGINLSADDNGYWVVDYYDIYDVTDESFIGVQQWDDDQDSTSIVWINNIVQDPLVIDYIEGSAGSTFTITGQDYPSDSSGTIYLNWQMLGDITTDEFGCFEFTFTMPIDAEPGIYIITVSVNPIHSISFTINPDSPLRTADQLPMHIDILSGFVDPIYFERIYAPVDPVEINQYVNVQIAFEDYLENDVIARWDWGDGTFSEGFISEFQVFGGHFYETPGVYSLSLILENSSGETEIITHEFVVVFDPSGDFVTGGGWIWSPEGAYHDDISLSGPASFGFVAKYKKGAAIPDGNTEFQFKVADLNFRSTSYDWLVVAGKRAIYKGVGTINGQGDYKFMISAIDGDLNGGDGVDKFRIRIWKEVDGAEMVIYDNQLGDDFDSDPTTMLEGGSIVIHHR